jgi:galactokinase
MQAEAAKEFDARYGGPPAVIASAPGRVNIIGEHVDYNDGLVLPFAIAQRIVVAGAVDDSGRVSAYSAPLDSTACFAVDVAGPAEPPAWENYVRGMVHGLRGEGVRLPGAKLWIGGDLAPGSGMSSSAALCVAIGMALAKLCGVDVPRARMARIAQAAEHHFAGTPCGLMDQMAACFGREGHALLLDCRDLSHHDVPCAPNGVAFLVIPSGVKHALADGAYERRVKSCQAALQEIQHANPQVTALRDASPEMLAAAQTRLDDATYRRARHVITELARLQNAVKSLRAGEWSQVGALLWQTQDSLRDDYEVSCPEIDELIALLREQAGVLGARMVGGGFGGIVLALVKVDRLEAVRRTVRTDYYTARGIGEDTFTVSPSAGAVVQAGA